MSELPFEVRHELAGWALYWALLEPAPNAAESTGDTLAELRRRTADQVKKRLRLDSLATEPAVAELRRLFRSAGTDPTRYRPSSEALLRRLLKGRELPALHPFVDINNCLSALLPAPCCVMDEQAIEPPFELRAGSTNEFYESLKGPFRLESRPVLVDAAGPCDSPITGSARVKVGPRTERAWLVAYLPASIIEPRHAERLLFDLLEAAPVATVAVSSAST
ncbi:MAG: phenylalanine--tRNA ligase beta subunit-related protein [Thermoanaerobaculia bacterium]